MATSAGQLRGKNCQTCSLAIQDGGVTCQGCEGKHHDTCARMEAEKKLPFTCRTCLATATKLHLRDVTLDQALLKFLVLGELPADAHEEARVQKAARYYTVDDMGLVWVLGSGRAWLRVPWLKDRGELVREIH